MRAHVFFVAVMLIPLAVSSASAQSMWPRRDPKMADLYSDTNARNVGDLLTILVRETTDVENKDERELEKGHTSSGLFNFSGSMGSGTSGPTTAATSVNSSSSSVKGFEGKSEYTVEREFLDRVTVMVLDVQPNGNLVIGGKRRQMVAGEYRTLVISGVVRPNDVRPNNAVESTYVANLSMQYEGDGPETWHTNQGWLGRTLSKYWPF